MHLESVANGRGKAKAAKCVIIYRNAQKDDVCLRMNLRAWCLVDGKKSVTSCFTIEQRVAHPDSHRFPSVHALSTKKKTLNTVIADERRCNTDADRYLIVKSARACRRRRHTHCVHAFGNDTKLLRV